MLPQTGEVIMKWSPYLGIALILFVLLFVFIKRKKNDGKQLDNTEHSSHQNEQKNNDK